MHRYRTHRCDELRVEHVDRTARISGWTHRRRDHGQLVFLDLRDHFGLTQCVVDVEDATFAAVEAARVESVVTVTGRVVRPRQYAPLVEFLDLAVAADPDASDHAGQQHRCLFRPWCRRQRVAITWAVSWPGREVRQRALPSGTCRGMCDQTTAHRQRK